MILTNFLTTLAESSIGPEEWGATRPLDVEPALTALATTYATGRTSFDAQFNDVFFDVYCKRHGKLSAFNALRVKSGIISRDDLRKAREDAIDRGQAFIYIVNNYHDYVTLLYAHEMQGHYRPTIPFNAQVQKFVAKLSPTITKDNFRGV